jgi:hypothetical protein
MLRIGRSYMTVQDSAATVAASFQLAGGSGRPRQVENVSPHPSAIAFLAAESCTLI